MSAGIGLDVIEVGRVERALERHPRLAERLFTPGELAYARQRARPGRHLAARFAAKEAVTKALGERGLRPSEIEVEARQPPSVRLSGSAASAARERGLEVSISLTHSRETAAAVALVQGQPGA
jgi:holo-[acyl-carrier protein] synthase